MKKLVFLLMALYAFAAQAQLSDPYKNLEKYWYYRYRLVNDFMKIGPNAGESIPASRRQLAVNNNNDNGYLSWSADATIRLGTYISALATEYKQLSNNGMSTVRTEYELLHALNAFVRLDNTAEGYMQNIDATYPGNPDNLYGDDSHNGFFIRDDVPWLTFLGNAPMSTNPINHFNRQGLNSVQKVHFIGDGIYPKCPDPPQNATYPKTYQAAGSAFAGRYGGLHPNDPTNSLMPTVDEKFFSTLVCPPQKYTYSHLNLNIPRYPIEESQDQLASIWPGLGLTKMFVNNSNLQNIAADEAFKTIEWISNTFQWVIRNPWNNDCVYGVSPDNYNLLSFNKCSNGGALFLPSAEPAVSAVKKVTGNTSLNTKLPATAYIAFQAIQGGTNEDDITFVDNYAAFGNNWYFGGTLPFINTTWKSLKHHTIGGLFRSPHIPLLYRLVQNKGGIGDFVPENLPVIDLDDDIGTYEPPSYIELLNSAPPCGPYAYKSGRPGAPYSSKEWSGNDRLAEPYHRADLYKDKKTGQINGPGDADYNGLDYMYLFNLFTLLKGNDYLQKMNNPYYVENFNINYPDNNQYGKFTKQLTLNFLEYASLINKIESDGVVNFRGAKQIELLPGFDSKYGSTTLVSIKDYSCAGGYQDEQYHYAWLRNVILRDELAPLYEDPIPIEYGQDYQPMSFPVSLDGEDDYTDEEYSLYLDSLRQVILNSEDTTLIAIYLHYTDTSSVDSNSNKWGSKDPDALKSMKRSAKQKGKTIATETGWFSIYPNPSDGTFTLQLSSIGDYEIDIRNAVGMSVFKDKLTNESKRIINLDGRLPGGNYIIQIKGKDINHTERLTIIR